MPWSSFMEYESIQRFALFCQKYNLNIKFNDNNSSGTDLFINGCKIQMKYSLKPPNNGGSTYGYRISLVHGKKKVPYKKGENDYYVIELGSYHGEFLWLCEELLIEKGWIATDTQKGKTSLSVFPYDYVEKRLSTMPNTNRKELSDRKLVHGNWTSNKEYWFSTEKGCLGHSDCKGPIHC